MTDSRALPQDPQPRWLDRACHGGVLALVFLLGCTDLLNLDFWWHLRTGELIRDRGTVPATDWFTFTNPDNPWIDLHWSFQLAVAWLWELGGAAAVIVAKSLTGTAAFAIALATRPPSLPAALAAGIWLPCVIAFSDRFYARPEIVTCALLAAVLWIVHHARHRPWVVWLLPLVQLVWVNAQGLFILGPAVVACLLAAAGAHRLGLGDRAGCRLALDLAWRRWLAVLGLMIAACFANPYGARGAAFPFVLFTRISGQDRAFYRRFAGEFQTVGEFLAANGGLAAVFTHLTMAMLALAFGLAVLGFWRLARRGRFDPYRALLFAAFAYLTWQATRNVVLFAVVAGCVTCWNAAELRELAAGAPEPRRWRRPAIAAALGLLLLSVPTNVLHSLRPVVPGKIPVYRRFGFGQTPRWYAHEEARFLARPGMPRKVYAAHQGQAAVAIYHLAPDRRVFADGRLEANTRTTLARYLEVAGALRKGDPKAERALLDAAAAPFADGELPALLVDRFTLATSFPQLPANPRWRAVFTAGVAAVFLDEARAAKIGLARIPTEELRRRLYPELFPND